MKAPEAKRAKVDSADNPSANTAELPSDLSHAPGHTHAENNQFLPLRVFGHTHEELDKITQNIDKAFQRPK
jgi:hypothetical protein